MSPAPAIALRLASAAALLACALLPALAQDSPPPAQQPSAAAQPAAAAQQDQAPDMGRIHGRVINPMGQPQSGGAISLSTDGGETLQYTFPVSATGEYSGEASLGEYMMIYRAADTPEGKVVDYIQGVVVLAGKDVSQDDNMTRPEYLNRLSPEQREQLQKSAEVKAAEAAAKSAVTGFNADLQTVNQDFTDAQNARAAAVQALGDKASPADIQAKAAEIQNAKFTEIQSLMTKDTASAPDESVLWIGLARAQTGLKNFLDAETNFKKALALESKAPTPQPQLLAAAESGLGEVYARTLMVDEANAAFDAAVKADPADAAIYLRNQAVIFFEEKNASAQVDAADKAIKADPSDAFLYYLKAQGLAQSAVFDPATDKSVLPPGCEAAFRKYLELAPNGPFAAEINDILARTEEKLSPPKVPSDN